MILSKKQFKLQQLTVAFYSLCGFTEAITWDMSMPPNTDTSSSGPPSGSTDEAPIFTLAQQQLIQQLVAARVLSVSEQHTSTSVPADSASTNTTVTSTATAATTAGPSAPGNIGEYTYLLPSDTLGLDRTP